MAIAIARNKRLLTHFFFRTIHTEYAFYGTPEEDLPALINSLTTAKTHKQLASAIEYSCLLLNNRYTRIHPGRLVTANEAITLLEGYFEPTDAKKLAQEMFMASPKPLRANASKSSPAAALDAYSSDFIKKLEERGAGIMVAVEPVQDWMMFRNLLAIGAALLANIERIPEDGKVMEAAGFFRSETNAFGFPIYTIPFKFQASTFALDFAKHPGRSSRLTPRELDHLYWLYNDSDERIVHRDGFLPVETRPFGRNEDVFFTTHYQAVKEGITPLDVAKVAFEQDTNVYLCARADLSNQYELAKSIIECIWYKTQVLMDIDGETLGVTQDPESLFDPEIEELKLKFHSLVSRCWYALCYHKGRKLIACKHCGCGVLASNRGPAKEFCSDSCRIQHSEELDG